LGKWRADDVGIYQVRSTRLDGGSLILHKTDKNEAIFVLVTGEAPEFKVRGWMRAVDGKQEKWWRDTKRPAYFVPQSVLEPMETLPGRGGE
jgi:hypothetical protein